MFYGCSLMLSFLACFRGVLMPRCVRFVLLMDPVCWSRPSLRIRVSNVPGALRTSILIFVLELQAFCPHGSTCPLCPHCCLPSWLFALCSWARLAVAASGHVLGGGSSPTFAVFCLAVGLISWFSHHAVLSNLLCVGFSSLAELSSSSEPFCFGWGWERMRCLAAMGPCSSRSRVPHARCLQLAPGYPVSRCGLRVRHSSPFLYAHSLPLGGGSAALSGGAFSLQYSVVGKSVANLLARLVCGPCPLVYFATSGDHRFQCLLFSSLMIFALYMGQAVEFAGCPCVWQL